MTFTGNEAAVIVASAFGQVLQELPGKARRRVLRKLSAEAATIIKSKHKRKSK